MKGKHEKILITTIVAGLKLIAGLYNQNHIPANIRKYTGMTDRLSFGDRKPKETIVSHSPYCRLGIRRKEAQLDAELPTIIYCNRRKLRW